MTSEQNPMTGYGQEEGYSITPQKDVRPTQRWQAFVETQVAHYRQLGFTPPTITRYYLSPEELASLPSPEPEPLLPVRQEQHDVSYLAITLAGSTLRIFDTGSGQIELLNRIGCDLTEPQTTLLALLFSRPNIELEKRAVSQEFAKIIESPATNVDRLVLDHLKRIQGRLQRSGLEFLEAFNHLVRTTQTHIVVAADITTPILEDIQRSNQSSEAASAQYLHVGHNSSQYRQLLNPTSSDLEGCLHIHKSTEMIFIGQELLMRGLESKAVTGLTELMRRGLTRLAQTPNTIVSFSQLAEAIWGNAAEDPLKIQDVVGAHLGKFLKSHPELGLKLINLKGDAYVLVEPDYLSLTEQSKHELKSRVSVIEVGNLIVDFENKMSWESGQLLEGKEQKLQEEHLHILAFFTLNQGRRVSFQEIGQYLQAKGYPGDPNDTHRIAAKIAKIREKIGLHGHTAIETVYGVGFIVQFDKEFSKQ